MCNVTRTTFCSKKEVLSSSTCYCSQCDCQRNLKRSRCKENQQLILASADSFSHHQAFKSINANDILDRFKNGFGVWLALKVLQVKFLHLSPHGPSQAERFESMPINSLLLFFFLALSVKFSISIEEFSNVHFSVGEPKSRRSHEMHSLRSLKCT